MTLRSALLLSNGSYWNHGLFSLNQIIQCSLPTASCHQNTLPVARQLTCFDSICRDFTSKPSKRSEMTWSSLDLNRSTCVCTSSHLTTIMKCLFLVLSCHNDVLFSPPPSEEKCQEGIFPIMTLSLLIIVWLWAGDWLKPSPLHRQHFPWGADRWCKRTRTGGNDQSMLWFTSVEKHWTCKGNYDGGHAECNMSPAALIMFLLHFFYL